MPNKDILTCVMQHEKEIKKAMIELNWIALKNTESTFFLYMNTDNCYFISEDGGTRAGAILLRMFCYNNFDGNKNYEQHCYKEQIDEEFYYLLEDITNLIDTDCNMKEGDNE